MEYLPLSLLAGILTILAPCVLPLLPVIIGGSLERGRDYKRAVVIIITLAVAVIFFTLLLKVSTLLISVDPMVWKLLSGILVILLGFFMVFPGTWSTISLKIGLTNNSHKALNQAQHYSDFTRDIIIGLALGPVFTSCSPTYGVIISIILPQNFTAGMANLLVYTLGLVLALLAVAMLGQEIVTRLRWVTNPDGWFHKIIGLLFILTGLAVIMGLDKELQTFILEAGYYDTVKIETDLLERY